MQNGDEIGVLLQMVVRHTFYRLPDPSVLLQYVFMGSYRGVLRCMERNGRGRWLVLSEIHDGSILQSDSLIAITIRNDYPMFRITLTGRTYTLPF
jgi:hypothetical protein